jgi:hypothetical protein
LSERALTRYWRWRLLPWILRYPTVCTPDPPSIARVAAAARLSVEHEFVASSVEELRAEYARRYGFWPFEEATDVRGYYERDYFRVLEVAAPAQELLAATPVGRLEDYA